ncbi:MAG: glycosyltransferase family 1 protein, partial [Myxococcota bacterium]
NAASAVFAPGPRGRFWERFGRYVLVVSSIDPRKNIGAAVSAFKAMGDPSLKLLLVGTRSAVFAEPTAGGTDGPNIERITRITEDELLDLYRGAELLCYPSFYEGFGLPPIEAMASGCPVVASDIGSISEVCGDAAILCNPHDHGAISAAMRSVIKNPGLRTDLVERGFKRAKKFNWKRSADRLAEVVEAWRT